ncbi:hypothetical protein H6P81_015299 [Aristolochia fimbriata]|uniref:Pectinesterase catalytic domain-containing protein n=1 Tax=Aristolochia fimbriata TaxID=158543 RepID=A0AAV7E585_ARIFI|nr:hypothetical protein H6P81_015299 [Aristolochia fimbriata]
MAAFEPMEIEIGGGNAAVAIPNRINIGDTGFSIPIPQWRRVLFSCFRALVFFCMAAAFVGYSRRLKQERHSFTVAVDGRGDFTTISAAVAAAPNHSPSSFRIYIKTEKTIIAYSEEDLNSTYSAATVYVRGDDFVARDITFMNKAETHRGAPAFTSEGNRTVVHRCNFEGYRHTVFARFGYHFYRDFNIYGTSDIIFGSATAVFQQCTIFAGLPGVVGDRITVTAHASWPRREPSVFSLHICTITRDLRAGRETASDHIPRGYLGTVPWPSSSSTVVMQSILDEVIDPHDWLPNNTTTVGPSGFYGEYDNRGPGAKRLMKSRHSANILTADGAQNFTVAKLLLHGDEWQSPSSPIPPPPDDAPSSSPDDDVPPFSSLADVPPPPPPTSSPPPLAAVVPPPPQLPSSPPFPSRRRPPLLPSRRRPPSSPPAIVPPSSPTAVVPPPPQPPSSPLLPNRRRPPLLGRGRGCRPGGRVAGLGRGGRNSQETGRHLGRSKSGPRNIYREYFHQDGREGPSDFLSH